MRCDVELAFVVPNEWVEKIKKSSFEGHATAIKSGVELDLWTVNLEDAYELSSDSDFKGCPGCVDFIKLIDFLDKNGIEYYDYGTLWIELDNTALLSIKIYLSENVGDCKEFFESVKNIHEEPDFWDDWNCSWYYIPKSEMEKLPDLMAKKEVVSLYNKLKENNLEPHVIYIVECFYIQKY